jgi:hypothetical protein
MVAKIKRETSPEDIRRITRIELLSDKCYRSLALLRRPSNAAVWAALTECIRQFQDAIPDNLYGTRHHINAVTNFSLAATQFCEFVKKYGRKDEIAPTLFDWNPRIASEAVNAIAVARGYADFCGVFPYWHAQMYAAEVVDECTIRFVSNASPLGRRVTAYHQGIRPRGSKPYIQNTALELTPTLQRLFARSYSTATVVGRLAVKFSFLRELREALFEVQEARSDQMRRRYPTTVIGGYTLDDFKKFYSAINAIAGAHEHLYHLWSQANALPLGSAVLVEHRFEWVRQIRELTKLDSDLIYEMLADTTFGRVPSTGFQVLPFVPLRAGGSVLALAPPFPLSSNWEENILGCLSRLDSDRYSAGSVTKEDEMREPLIALTSGTRLVTGGFKLPKSLPDIDLIVEDIDTRVLIVCELKWCRMPSGYKQKQERDREIRKGVGQIEAIRKFLEAHPSYLMDRKFVTKNLTGYNVVHFCVVARDHLQLRGVSI